jgi:cation diffusion facilitator CzcD-associated flavoprotein CzcO
VHISSSVPDIPIPSSATTPPEFLSPVYPALITNIPHSIMAYSNCPFPGDGQIPLFPRHETVLEYLKGYANQLNEVVRYSAQVVDVHPLGDLGNGWSLTVKDIIHGEEQSETYDAVIIANGHFNDAFVPDMPGLSQWKGEITHSKFFRGAEAYEGKV